VKTIVVISRDVSLLEMVRSTCGCEENMVAFDTVQSALDYIYNAIPNLMVLDMLSADLLSVRLLNTLKSDPIFSQLPVIAVIDDDSGILNWEEILVEDFIRKSDLLNDLKMRLNLCLVRSERIVEISPLTRLPGNISINKQIQERIDRNMDFALAYADLDNFKPFNDAYGFSRGDDVIKMSARIILNIVKNSQGLGSFVGHIGGDDLVFIADRSKVETISQEIIDSFDRIIPTFYDAKDRRKGHIESVDRQGAKRTFPIMTISIGITSNRPHHFTHYGQITQLAADMKKQAKRHHASCYRIDKRQPS
jgi:diguanylate cyclase (GGDEF)-like protein